MMSFMFNLYPDKECNPINHPGISAQHVAQVVCDIPSMAQCLLEDECLGTVS